MKTSADVNRELQSAVFETMTAPTGLKQPRRPATLTFDSEIENYLAFLVDDTIGDNGTLGIIARQVATHGLGLMNVTFTNNACHAIAISPAIWCSFDEDYWSEWVPRLSIG